MPCPDPNPKKFRDDVVAVARRGDASVAEVAKDLGIAESCLRNWLKAADVADGKRPGVSDDAAELRELRRRNRLLEQENETLRRAAAYLFQANLPVNGSTRS